MVISLGHEYAGMFANDEDLAAKLLSAADASNDKLWRFPLSPAYDKLLDSPIADIKNIGPREAGSITAAQFLKLFEIGRTSCRERVCQYVLISVCAVSIKKKNY